MATQLFEPGSPEVLYIVDISSYVLRAYHAIAPLSSPSGEPTHAVHGTVNMLERLRRTQRPALFAAALDSGRETFRRQIYSDYKANRPRAPEDLRVQLERCEQILNYLGIATYKQPGVEADDLIASLVKRATAEGLRVVVVGADKDLMQLVSPEVVLFDSMRDRVYGVPEVEERFGVSVSQLRDLLALMGDSSDNVPGVPSVGPKTARELLTEFGTLEGIYAHLEQVTKKKLKATLSEHRDQAFLSQKLVTLKDDCPVDFALAALKGGKQKLDELKRVYTELGFSRQLDKLLREPETELPTAIDTGDPEPESPAEIGLLLEESELLALLEKVRTAKRLAIFVQANSESKSDRTLIGLGLCADRTRAFYLPLGHRYVGAPKQLGADRVVEMLGPVLADPAIRKIGQDLKHTEVLLAEHGLGFEGFGLDSQLACYLIDPEAPNDVTYQAQNRLGQALISYDEVTKHGRRRLDFDAVSVEEAMRFVARRAEALFKLEAPLTERLQADGLTELYEKLELPLSRVLAQMEQVGVLVDTERLKGLGARCDESLKALEAKAQTVAGHAFNVHSPRQLESILFDEIKLKPIKRTKTARSTDAATLEVLSEQHELPAVILEIRQISKLKGTYIDALPALVNPKTGRIHTSWEQAVAATGRLSSTDPNLQNIPIRTELGREVRTAFVAPEAHQLVSADYSQIELRVLAHLSQDPVLLDAFRTGQDIHTRTAMEIFEVEQDQVTREMRTKSKAVNFGIIYGQGDSGLAKATGISRSEAGAFIAAYFRRYQGVQRFMNQTLDAARAGEAVRSLLGRHRRLADIKSGNRARRLAAERVAMNMPIQGSAADLLKLAMLALKDPVTPGARMILTVHDELVFEVPDAEVDDAEGKIKTAMQNVYPLSVPLVVDVGHGDNWNEAH